MLIKLYSLPYTWSSHRVLVLYIQYTVGTIMTHSELPGTVKTEKSAVNYNDFHLTWSIVIII